MGTADEVSVTIPLCYKVISSTFLRSRQASQRRNDVDDDVDDNDNNDDAAAARVQIFQGFLSWACRCYDRIASRLVKSTGVKETKNGAEHAWDKKLFFTTELNLWNSNLDRFKVIKMFRLLDASASMDRLKRGSNPFPKRNECCCLPGASSRLKKNCSTSDVVLHFPFYISDWVTFSSFLEPTHVASRSYSI